MRMYSRNQGLPEPFVRIQKGSSQHGTIYDAEKISGFRRKPTGQTKHRLLHTKHKCRQDKSIFRTSRMHRSNTSHDNAASQQTNPRRRLHPRSDVGIRYLRAVSTLLRTEAEKRYRVKNTLFLLCC